MKVDGYKCDECGADKKSTNHWFMVYRAAWGGLVFAPWDSPLNESELVKHLCGQQCAQKVLEQWMSSKS